MHIKMLHLPNSYHTNKYSTCQLVDIYIASGDTRVEARVRGGHDAPFAGRRGC